LATSTYSEKLANAKSILDDLMQSPKLTYTVNGQTFQWNAYQKLLMEQIDWLEKKVMTEETGPWEESTKVVV